MKLYCDKCDNGRTVPTIYASADKTQWLCEKHWKKENEMFSTPDELDFY